MAKFHLDPRKPPKLTAKQKTRLDAMTDKAITAAAAGDPDNRPLTNAELSRLETARTVKRVRNLTKLSQSQFARCYWIKLSRLRDWEQGRVTLDSASSAYLTLIERSPKTVARTLERRIPERQKA
jgi:DNA-binding transcriptional regulator YiaG